MPKAVVLSVKNLIMRLKPKPAIFFIFYLLLFHAVSMGVVCHAIVDDLISVEVGHFRFNLPAYLTNSNSSACISSSIKLPYYGKQIVVMNEVELSDFSKNSYELDEISVDDIRKTSADDWEITTQPLGHILGHPSVLTASYSNRIDNKKLYQLLSMTIKIKMPEGVVSFRTLQYDLPQVNVEQFIEDEKDRFVKWIQLFMPSYKWIGSHSRNQVEGYKSQYGAIKCRESVASAEFEIFINYHDKNIVTDLLIISNNPQRYEMAKGIISMLIQTWLSGHTSAYRLEGASLREVKGRIGIELVIAIERGAMFYWFELTPLRTAYYTSFDISGEVSFPIFHASDFEDVAPDPVALWNQIVNNL